jgi:hypothetical protein
MRDDRGATLGAQPWTSAGVARWAGVLGFIIPGLTLVVYPIWSMPTTQMRGAELALWATDHDDRLAVTMLLDVVGVTVWLVFGAAVWTDLRDQLPARSTLPACFAAGFLGCVTLLLSGFTAFAILLYREHSSEVSILLCDLTFGLLAMSELPTIVAAWSCAVAVYVHRALPRSAGHFAVAAAAAHPLLLATLIIRGGPLSLEGFSITAMPGFLFAWILGTALAMPRVTQ